MAQQTPYLSTDPNAGEYLSTDPNAGESVMTPTPSTPSGGLGGFLSEATQGINPIKINEALQQAFWHPIDTAKGMLAAQDVPRQEAMTAFQQGDVLTGTRKMIDWLIPVLGPRLDEAADYMQQGQVARGLGATADVGLTIAAPKIVGAVGSRIPTRAGTARTMGRIAEQQVVDVMAPKVGPEKIRFGVQAAEVAPAVARRTTARTVGGLLDEVGENAARSYQALDQAYATLTQPQPTQPILAALDNAINRLTVRGAGGGTGVQPVLRAERLAALRQARTEVAGLGRSASPSQLRQLRIAWDEGAEAVFTPKTADNFRGLRQEGHGWADARTALNNVIVGRNPHIAPLNADAHLWTMARNVVQAAEEVERVRPRVGRRLVGSMIGAGIGGYGGGGFGAALGAAIAPTVEMALASASPTVKLTMARGLARLSDAIATGSPRAAQAAIQTIGGVLPAA